jgi:CRISPR/Cas system type I-B associated protein Csh2 (Cas7 group RAMP superfamily)
MMAGETEFMMPVPPEGAAMQFFIEALKANTAETKGMRDDLRAERQERREDRKKLDDIYDRVVRIEEQRISARVESLDQRVNALEADKDKRDGATSALASLWKNLPSIGAVIIGVVSIAFLILKASGKI